MKIKIKRLFRVQVSARKSREYQPGIYDVGVDISQIVADKVLRYGKADIIVDAPVKVVPEKKVVEAPENKFKVAAKPGRRRSTRTKPNE